MISRAFLSVTLTVSLSVFVGGCGGSGEQPTTGSTITPAVDVTPGGSGKPPAPGQGGAGRREPAPGSNAGQKPAPAVPGTSGPGPKRITTQ